MQSLLPKVDEWYRRRLRAIIWKRIRTRLRNLIKLGIAKYKAWEYANTRKSYWRTANSPILNRAVTNDRLKQAEYIFFYRLLQESQWRKLKNRRVPNGTHGGVRGQIGN